VGGGGRGDCIPIIAPFVPAGLADGLAGGVSSASQRRRWCPAVAINLFKHARCCTLLVLPHFRAAHGHMDVLRCTTRPARSAVDVSCTKWTPNTGHSDTQRHFPFEFEWASARVFLALPADCPITPPGVLQGKAGRSRGHCTVHSHMALGKLTFTEETPGGWKWGSECLSSTRHFHQPSHLRQQTPRPSLLF
jgi:hypothetical protein